MFNATARFHKTKSPVFSILQEAAESPMRNYRSLFTWVWELWVHEMIIWECRLNVLNFS